MVGDSYSGLYPFLFLGLNPIPEMRSHRDGWIVTVTEMVSTYRVHGAVCPRQVQMHQAVGLGQEQVQVLYGKNDSFRERYRHIIYILKYTVLMKSSGDFHVLLFSIKADSMWHF